MSDKFNKELFKAIQAGDTEHIDFLLRNKDSFGVKRQLSNLLGDHVRENYDNPLDIFENKKIVEQTPIKYADELPGDTMGKYVKSDKGIILEKQRPLSVKLHEIDHVLDDELHGFNAKNVDLSKVSGKIEDMREALAPHHKRGFFEYEALKSLANNKKLTNALPYIGKGLAGLAALGVANKAMGGEYGEATADAADLGTDLLLSPTNPIGIAKMALRPASLGQGSDKVDLQKLSKSNESEVESLKSKYGLQPEQQKFKKLLDIMENK